MTEILGNLFSQVFRGAAKSIGTSLATLANHAASQHLNQSTGDTDAEPNTKKKTGRSVVAPPVAVTAPPVAVVSPPVASNQANNQVPVAQSAQGIAGFLQKLIPKSPFAKFALGIGVAAAGLTGLGAGFLKLKRVGENYADKQVEAGRSLAQFSGQIGYAYAKLEYNRLQNEFGLARATQNTSSALVESQTQRENTQQRDRKLSESLKNIAAYYGSEISGAINKAWVNLTPGLTQLAEKIERDWAAKNGGGMHTWNDALIKRAEHYGKPQMPPMKH